MQIPTNRSFIDCRWVRLLGTGALALGVVVLTSGAAGAASSTPTNAPIGASGSVAALAASSMEVQNANTGQTTVNWTGTTSFTQTVSESVSSLASGDCVTVSGTPSKTSKTTIAARSITVQAASSTGSCTTSRPGGTSGFGGGFGGGGNFRPGGAGGTSGSGTRPSFPSGSGRRFPGAGSFAIVVGKVTGVSGSTIKMTGTDLSLGSFARPSSSKSSKKPAKPKTEKLTVTSSSSTTVSATQSAAASDLAVGDCVSAFGAAASNGTVTANTVRISSSTGGTCSGGFGGFGGGFGRFGGGTGGSAGGSGA